MPRMSLTCDWCGKNYESYQCGKNYHFCSIECRRKAGKLVNASINEEAKKKATEHIREHLRRGGGRLANSI